MSDEVLNKLRQRQADEAKRKDEPMRELVADALNEIVEHAADTAAAEARFNEHVIAIATGECESDDGTPRAVYVAAMVVANANGRWVRLGDIKRARSRLGGG